MMGKTFAANALASAVCTFHPNTAASAALLRLPSLAPWARAIISIIQSPNQCRQRLVKLHWICESVGAGIEGTAHGALFRHHAVISEHNYPEHDIAKRNDHLAGDLMRG